MSWLGNRPEGIDKSQYSRLEEDNITGEQPALPETSSWGIRTVKKILAFFMFWRWYQISDVAQPAQDKIQERAVVADHGKEPVAEGNTQQASAVSDENQPPTLRKPVNIRYLRAVPNEASPVQSPTTIPADLGEAPFELRDTTPRYYKNGRAFVVVEDLAEYGVDLAYLEGVERLPENRTYHIYNKQLGAMQWLDDYIRTHGIPKGYTLHPAVEKALILKQATLNSTLTRVSDKDYPELCRSAKHCMVLPFKEMENDESKCRQLLFKKKVMKTKNKGDAKKSTTKSATKSATKSTTSSSQHDKRKESGRQAKTHKSHPQRSTLQHNRLQAAFANVAPYASSESEPWDYDTFIQKAGPCTQENADTPVLDNFSHISNSLYTEHLKYKYIQAIKWFSANSDRQQAYQNHPDIFGPAVEPYLLDETMLQSLIDTLHNGHDPSLSMVFDVYKNVILYLDKLCAYLDKENLLYDQ